MGTTNQVQPTLQDRIARLEELYRQGVGALQMSFSVGPNGAVQFGNGIVAPSPGGALDTLTNVQTFTPPQPVTATGNDGTQSWVDVTIPSSLYGSGTAAQQIADWDVEVTPGIYQNVLPYTSAEMTPAHGWSVLSDSTVAQENTVAYVGYGCLKVTVTRVAQGSTVMSAIATLPSAPANTTFTGSVWVRHATGTARSVAVRIMWLNASNQQLGTSSAGTAVGPLTSTWQRVSVTAQTPTPAGAAKARLMLETTTSGSIGDTFYVDHAAILTGTGLSPSSSEYGGVRNERVNAPVVLTSAGPRIRIWSIPPGVESEVRIRGVSKLGVPTQWSPGLVVAVAPDNVAPTTAPVGVTVSGGQTSVVVWWDPDTTMPPDVASWQGTFDAQITTNADTSWSSPIATKRVPGGICGFDGLTANTTYRVRVRAVDAAGNVGPWSADVTVTTNGSGAAAPSEKRWIAADMIATLDLRAVNAVIGNATITNAKINDLSVSKLTTGSLNAGTVTLTGGDIRSAGFVPGSSGWQITAAGNAEFNSVIVRGTVAGSTITGGTINIGSGNFQVASNGNLTTNGSTTINNSLTVGATSTFNSQVTINGPFVVENVINHPGGTNYVVFPGDTYIHYGHCQNYWDLRNNPLYIRDISLNQVSEYLQFDNQVTLATGRQGRVLYGESQPWYFNMLQWVWQADGNVVLYNQNTVLWASGTAVFSSREAKENVEPVARPMDKIRALQPVTFTYKQGVDPRNLGPQLGLIVEDVEPVDPCLIHTIKNMSEPNKDGEYPDVKLINYDRVGVLALAGVKDVDARLAAVERILTSVGWL
jgi:hypothetical protein